MKGFGERLQGFIYIELPTMLNTAQAKSQRHVLTVWRFRFADGRNGKAENRSE
jgi:hypothetical protein